MPFLKELSAQTEYPGNVVFEGRADDRRWGPFPIGFDFDFFGNTYNEFFASSNGLVLFGAGSNAFSNVSIPNGARPDNYIAPFWDDLIIHETGDILYQTIGTAPNRKLVIQFSNMSFWTSTVLLGHIQVILYEGSNNIQIQYMNIVDRSSDRASGNSATIGLENMDGTAGVLCSYNTAGYVFSGRAILFTPGGGTYTFDENALYDDMILVNDIPKAGIPGLISPIHNSSVEETVTFMWEAASHATSYFVVISQNSDMSSPVHTSADLTDLSYSYTLTPEQTYFWSANAKNASGDITWSEIWSFKTTLTPELTAVPQTFQLDQGDLQELTLLYTGGDTGPKTATITSLPGEGVLYQSNSGVPGAQITTVPSDVSDPFHHVFYSASGAAGSGAGSFDFHFSDGTGSSPDARYTIHVSPPGIPNFLYAAKETDRVEISFDRPMSDPTGFHAEFAVEDNGVGVTSTSCSLKAGDPSTIVVYVSPGLNTANDITVAYTRGSVTAANGAFLESFGFQLAAKLAQTISFNALPDRTYGDADFTLSASASSGLPVTFSTSNSTIVSVTGTTATVNNAGEAYITASQAGDASYAAASFERLQVVNKANATVTLSNLNQVYTGTGISATATTAPAGLVVLITYDGSATLPVDPGTYAVVANIVENNYSGSASATLTISDNEGPVPDVPVLPDLLDECSVTPIAPTATDLYAGQVTGTTGTPFPIIAQGTTVITWTYNDGQGNTTTQTQNVVIDDQSDPAIPVLTDQIADCSDTVAIPTTTDNCAGTVSGTTTDPLIYSVQGTYVINWTFADGNGNSVSASQNVIVSDLSDPEIPTLPDLTGECSVSAVAPSTTDACAGIITGTTTDPLDYSNQGVYVIQWTFDDGNGNSIVVPQNVIVDDVTDPVAPVLPDITGECSTTATIPSTTDACAGTITGTTVDALSYFMPGDYVITWSFDDGNGNMVNATQNVSVTDNTPPTATVPADVTSCDGRVSAIGLMDVSDNCSTAPVISYQLSGATTGSGSDDASGEVFAPGVTTVTYTVDDTHGNTSQFQLTVTYQAVEDIVVTLSNGTLTCETSGTYQWINCADNSIIAGETNNTFSPGVNGEYAVILTQGPCSDTSDCYSMDYSGVGDSRYQDYNVYPNPAQDWVKIDLNREHTNVSIKVFDTNGNLLKIEESDRMSTSNLDLTEFKSGLYLIQIHSDQLSTVARIIKE
jgi:hypothetical protein